VAVRKYSAIVKFGSVFRLHAEDLNVTMGAKGRAFLGAAFLGWGE
jgi:hypothetical protein